jgi:hypothetical protein
MVKGDGIGIGGGAIAPLPVACAEGGLAMDEMTAAEGAVGVACGVDTVELLAFEIESGAGVERAVVGGPW